MDKLTPTEKRTQAMAQLQSAVADALNHCMPGNAATNDDLALAIAAAVQGLVNVNVERSPP